MWAQKDRPRLSSASTSSAWPPARGFSRHMLEKQRSTVLILTQGTQVPCSACRTKIKPHTRRGFIFVGAEGFEPSTNCLRGNCSNQLSYAPMRNDTFHNSPKMFNAACDEALERNARPTGRCEAGHQLRWWAGFIRACAVNIFGAPARNRTQNLLVRSQALYPIELRAQKCLYTIDQKHLACQRRQ